MKRRKKKAAEMNVRAGKEHDETEVKGGKNEGEEKSRGKSECSYKE